MDREIRDSWDLTLERTPSRSSPPTDLQSQSRGRLTARPSQRFAPSPLRQSQDSRRPSLSKIDTSVATVTGDDSPGSGSFRASPTSTRASSPRGSVHSLRSMFQRPKKSLAAVLGRLGYAAPAEGYFFDTTRFDAAKVGSFAIYLGDCSTLLERSSEWNSIDLLVLDFQNLRDLWETPYATRLCGGLSHSQSYDALGTTSVGSFDADVKPPPRALHKSSSTSSIRSFQTSSSVGSRLSRISRFWRSRSATSLKDLVERDMDTTPLSENFCSIVLARVSHLVVSVNINSLYEEYKHTVQTAGTSFTQHVTTYLAQGLALMPSAVSGFLFTDCKKWLSAYSKDLAAEKIAKLVHALRESTDEEWHQPLIFLDTDIGWGRIRDEINGLLVANVFMDGRGGRKMLFGEERQALKAFTTKLSIEFSLRSDFLIMNSEAIPSTPSAALLRSHVQWATGLKCVPWYTTSLGYDQVSDVKPMEFNEVSEDGIFEMASNDDVLRCKDTVDINIAFLRARKVGLEITHEGWANVVNPASSIPRDFLDALREGAYTDGIPECDDDLMASNPLLPEPDSYVEIKQITQSRRASGAGDLLRTGSDDQAATEPLIPSVYDFGLDWQGPRYRNGVCNAVLTVMFELLDKKLLASARYNIDDADASKNGDELPDFMSFVKLLNDMVERPNRATSWLMSLLSEATVKAALTELGQFLVEGKISVWLPTKAAFLSATNNSPHIQIWGLAEERDGVLHMFIADNSLRWGEVVLHLFMKWRLGWETRRCIVIEAMYEAQTLEVQSLTLPIPARLNQQVDTSCPSELLAIVRDSEPVLDELRCAIGTILSANCASYLSAVCCYLRRRAEWRLVDQREYLDSVRRGLSAGYTPDNAIETRMVQFVSRCTLQAHGRKRICAVAKAIEAEMRKRGGTLPVSPMLGGPAELWTLCYIFAVFWKAIRRVGYETLIIELMNMNPLFLPEADQVAVSLEMVTTNKNLVTVFGVDSLTMGEIIHPILRATSLKELNHIEKSRGQHPVPVSDSADISKDIDDGNVLAGAESTEDAADSGMTAFRKSILNAYIYVYPIFLDIILLASLGSGIFATDRMDAETRELTSLVLLVMFPITGAVMNSIGRTVTYYYFQKSIPLMVSAFYRRLSAAIIIFTAAGIILGGVNFYRTGDIVLSALGLLYSVVFGMFMLFFSVLVILREPDEYFYHSRGPLAILKMLLILIPNAFLCRFVLPKDINRLVPFALYIGSLLLATVYMAFTYTSVTGQYLRWPHIVKVPQKRQILELYKVSYPPPQQSGADDQGAVARATRRWERDALEWYANVTVEAMERKRADDETMESVKERLSTWYWENLLMKWYIQRLGVHAPKPFTGEWDTLIKQGIVELKKKFTVEKMNRGGILFDNEFPAICFGFLYFILLFVDKWTVLFVTGRAVMFLRNDVIGASNTDSLLGATVFLLLTSGVLELTLARYYEHHKRIPMLSVGKSKGPNSLIENHKDAVQWIFASELRRFLFALVLFLIPITLAVLFLGDRQDQGLKMTIFGLSSFGFTGLLIGLFIKLFITSLEVAVNVFMTVALLIGIGATTAILHVTGAVEYASLATAITGWIFALGCIISQQKEKLRSVHYRVRVSPALSSSGQRYMGQTETAYTSAARDRLAAELMSNIKDAVRIQSELGGNWIIRESIQRSREQIATLPAGHIIHSAFPSALALLHELMEEMASARIVMLRNKKPLTAAGVRYSAISVREHRSGMLYVFVPPKDDDLSEIDDFQLLLEALIHEFLESRGQSHATACVSELLVGVSVGAWSQRLVDVPVPRRVATQRIDDTSRAILWHNSRNVVQGKAALGIDVDRMWNTKFTQRERVWFVDLSRIWWRSFQDGFDLGELPRSLTKRMASVPHSFKWHLIPRGAADSLQTVEHVRLRVAQCFLSSMVALRIREMVRYSENGRFTTPTLPTIARVRRPQAPPTPSLLERITIGVLDTRIALYLALTADERFGKESSSYGVGLRYPLAPVYWISRRLLRFLHSSAIYRRDPLIRQTLDRMKNGFRRTFRYETTERDVHRMFRVETVCGPAMSSVGLLQYGADKLEVNRYTLNTPNVDEWKHGKEKPSSQATYESVTVSGKVQWRITKELQFDKSGGIKETHFYTYPAGSTTLVPEKRFILCGLAASIRDAQRSDPIEIHTFKRVHGHVVVTDSTSRRYSAAAQAMITIEAQFSYSGGYTPDAANYSCAGPSWKIEVDYAEAYRKPGDIPRFLEIRLMRRNLGMESAVVTKVDYSHPHHIRYESVHRIPGEREYAVPTPREIIDDTWGVLKSQPPLCFVMSSDMFTQELKSRTIRSGWSAPPLATEFWSAESNIVTQREYLWAAWRSGLVPGVFARDLDERLSRSHPLLQAYWWRRDLGDKQSAQNLLRQEKCRITAELQMLDQPWTRTHFCIRFSDLWILGCGGDADRIFPEGEPDEENWSAEGRSQTEELLRVINLDSGTWPTGGGGVGSCRRDVIDGIERIRWTSLAELGMPELGQKDYPIERHIDSIKYIPLWDLDFGTPNENILRNVPYRELQARSRKTTTKLVEERFVPLIERLIDAAFTDHIATEDVPDFEDIFVQIYYFFQECDWTTAWNHVTSQETWIRKLLETSWIHFNEGKLYRTETPTLRHIEMLFDLISRLLLPLTVEIPNRPVVHASHHGIQAVLGVVAKKVHGSTFIVWDHGILWRERLFGLCTDIVMPKFVQCMFAGLTRLVARVVYARADYITPCTSIQNVHWEIWIAGGKYGNTREASETSRRVVPVLNGMDTARFQPNPKLQADVPTAVMLSHISPVKDVMNAINAARIIVRDFKLTNYQLLIYGSPEKEPPYTTECMRTIAAHGLEANVKLMGLGSPASVLPQGWIFVNSSITEGLPLALGEAGLCGLPVVCTDVGGSREVITNPKTNEVYGAVVPPSRPFQLALGQMRLFAITDGMEGQTLRLDELLTRGSEKLIERIMYPNVMEMRQRIGEKLRERVRGVFSIKRYWREHEQVLWLGKIYREVWEQV